MSYNSYSERCQTKQSLAVSTGDVDTPNLTKVIIDKYKKENDNQDVSTSQSCNSQSQTNKSYGRNQKRGLSADEEYDQQMPLTSVVSRSTATNTATPTRTPSCKSGRWSTATHMLPSLMTNRRGLDAEDRRGGSLSTTSQHQDCSDIGEAVDLTDLDLNDLSYIQLKNIGEVAAMALLRHKIERGSISSMDVPLVFRRNATILKDVKNVALYHQQMKKLDQKHGLSSSTPMNKRVSRETTDKLEFYFVFLFR